jgi:site-specific recombinase XerD
MDRLGVSTLLEVTPDVLRSYLSAEASSTYVRGGATRTVGKTTVHLRQKAAGTFLNWCVEQNLIRTSPMRKVRGIPRPNPERTAFTDDEVRRLLAEASRGNWWLAERDTAMLMVMIGTGCRAAGLLNLTADSFDWQRGRVKLHEKGDKERWVKLGRATSNAVKEYIAKRPAHTGYDCFWLNAKNEPFDYAALNWRIRSLASYCTPPIEKASAHRFRHYFAVTWYRKNRDIMALMRILGHARVETTQQYLRSLGVEYALDVRYETPDEAL